MVVGCRLLVATGVSAETTPPRLAILPVVRTRVAQWQTQQVVDTFAEALEEYGLFEAIVIEDSAVEDAPVDDFGYAAAFATALGRRTGMDAVVTSRLSREHEGYYLAGRIINLSMGEGVEKVALVEEELEELVRKAGAAGTYVSEQASLMPVPAEPELVVVTEPAGATVLVNGENRGTAPLALTDVPMGIHTVEAFTESMHFEGSTIVGRGRNLVRLRLEPSYGGLAIRGFGEGYRLYLNGEEVPTSGTLEQVPAGEYRVMVETPLLRWNEEVSVRRDDLAQVTLDPRRAMVPHAEEQRVREELNALYRQAVAEPVITNDLLRRAANHVERLRALDKPDPALLMEAELVTERLTRRMQLQDVQTRLRGLEMERAEVQNRLADAQVANNTRTFFQWVSLGTGVAAGGLSGLFWYYADRAYRRYQEATVSTEAAAYRSQVEVWDALAAAGAGVALSGIAVSVTLMFLDVSLDEHRVELSRLNREIERLRGYAQ